MAWSSLPWGCDATKNLFIEGNEDSPSSTALYKCIKAKEWLIVEEFLNSGFWPYQLFEDRVTPAEQARVWSCDEEKQNLDGDIRQLPLHLALKLNGPFNVIRLLVLLYPESAALSDRNEFLPLQLALDHTDQDDVVLFILEANPEAAKHLSQSKYICKVLQCASKSKYQTHVKIMTAIVGQRYCNQKNNFNVKEMVGKLNEGQLKDLNNQLVALEDQRSVVQADLDLISQNVVKAQAELEEMEQVLLSANRSVAIADSLNLTKKSSGALSLQTGDAQRVKLLQACKKELFESLKALSSKEVLVRFMLNDFETYLAKMFRKDGMENFKNQVDKLKTLRQQQTREIIISELVSFHQALARFLKSVGYLESNEDVVFLRLMHDGLSAIDFQKENYKKLTFLAADILPAQADLHRTRTCLAIRKELDLLGPMLELEREFNKNAMESEVLEHLNHNLDAIHKAKHASVEVGDLMKILTGARALKQSFESKTLVQQTKRDLLELKVAADGLVLKATDETWKDSFKEMASSLSKLSLVQLESQAIEEILQKRKEFSAMKKVLDQKDVEFTLMRELDLLAKDVLLELKDAKGDKIRQLAAMLHTVTDLSKSKVECIKYDTLLSMITELQAVRLAAWKANDVDFNQTMITLNSMRSFLAVKGRDADNNLSNSGLFQDAFDKAFQMIGDLSGLLVLDSCFAWTLSD